MSFSEQAPSKQWAALTSRGELIAKVWFKPEDEPLVLVFRIPRDSFQNSDKYQLLTMENLLKGVVIANDEVESWTLEDSTGSALDERDAELRSPLPQPAHDVAYLEIHVRLKPPSQALTRAESHAREAPTSRWRDLEILWKVILGLEATVDTLRMNIETARAELDGSTRRSLSADDKVNALAADVADWNKAKGRIHFAVPKANEFIHRATWAAGTPERKKLGELFRNPIVDHTRLPEPAAIEQELESLRKDRLNLSAQGNAVYQECKAVTADVQAALRRLQTNAAIRASKKKGGTGAKGKSY